MSEIKYVDSVALGTFLTEIRKEFKQQIIDMVYPVGSIYMSFNNTNPATIFGGTWQQIEGQFLLAADSEHKVNSTGNGKLTEEHLPKITGSLGAGIGKASENNNYKNQYGAFRSADGKVFSLNTESEALYGYDHKDGVGFTTSPAHQIVDFSIGTEANEQQPVYPPYIAVYIWRRVPANAFTLNISKLDNSDNVLN